MLEKAFPTYPKGFPVPLLDEFARRTSRGWIGNKAASGTAIIDELGAEHQRTGKWIVYTSADSVFQIAAHEQTVPLGDLYQACAVAREMLKGENAVSRVIARPFEGKPGDYRRTPGRRDFSIAPTGIKIMSFRFRYCSISGFVRLVKYLVRILGADCPHDAPGWSAKSNGR